MFDTFEPFQLVQKRNFAFKPNRFEIWENGNMTSSGRTEFPIVAKVFTETNSEKMEVTIGDLKLHNDICSNNVFDEFVTSKDRLQLIIVPEQTKPDCMGIMGFRMILGATRAEKYFNRNEPYCCNLFLQKGIISKITFSFSNPERLIEFYS